jgi:hypothetical protein
MVSINETSILNQVAEWKRLLNILLPTDLAKLNFTKRIGFTRTGSSYWAATISDPFGEIMLVGIPCFYKVMISSD